MQRCTTCGSAYDDSFDECPRDGTPLFSMESEVYEDDLLEDSDTASSDDDPVLASSEETTDETDDTGKAVVPNPESDAVGDPTMIIPQPDQESLENLAQASSLEFESLAEDETEREAEEAAKDAEPQSPDEQEPRPRKQRERIARTQMGAPAIMSDSLDEESDPYPVALSDAAIPETPPSSKDSPHDEPPPLEAPATATESATSQMTTDALEADPSDDSSEEYPLAETLPGTIIPESDEPQTDVKQEPQPGKGPSVIMLALVFVLVFAATLAAVFFVFVL